MPQTIESLVPWQTAKPIKEKKVPHPTVFSMTGLLLLTVKLISAVAVPVNQRNYVK